VEDYRSREHQKYLNNKGSKGANFSYCTAEMYILYDLNLKEVMKDASWRDFPFDRNMTVVGILR
jgi:hypothetical protein